MGKNGVYTHLTKIDRRASRHGHIWVWAYILADASD
jgi:hypothetical protein